MTPLEREQYERATVFQNRIIYSLPVHIGHWYEDLAVRHEKIHRVLHKRDNCMLYIQKTRKMFRNLLQSTVLALESPYILYGENYQLNACDIKLSKDSTGLYLSGVVTEKEIDTFQHFRHGSGLTLSQIQEPCVRNTFKIMGCDENKSGHQVFYGEDVFLQIFSSEGPPLYIQCLNSNPDNFGEHLSVQLGADRDIYCRFKFLHWNPQKRYETTGTTIKPDTKLIIQHTASGRNLSVEPSQWIWSFYDRECMVSCHTYRDSHKMETDENFWRIVSRPISDTALYVRAARGENIPRDLFR